MTLAKLLLYSVTAFFFFGACAFVGVCVAMLDHWLERRRSGKVKLRPDWLRRFR